MQLLTFKTYLSLDHKRYSSSCYGIVSQHLLSCKEYRKSFFR